MTYRTILVCADASDEAAVRLEISAACDLVKLKRGDIASGGVFRDRATVIQKTGRPVPRRRKSVNRSRVRR